MDGNNSYKFLDKLNLMRPDVPAILHPVLDTLQVFQLVVTRCFSWELADDYKKRITNFTRSYKNLIIYANKKLDQKLTVTWKVHCVTAHLSSFLTKHGRGMADVCEQVGESAHHAMVPFLQRIIELKIIPIMESCS